MPNNCLSVLYKRIIQVENKNVGLKVGGGGTNIPLPPQSKKWGGAHAPLAPPPPPRFLRQCNNYKQAHARKPEANLGGPRTPTPLNFASYNFITY